MTTFIPFQARIRQPIPTIHASKEFRDFAELLERMDEILIQSEIEQEVVVKYLEVAQRDGYYDYEKLVKEQEKIRKALRCSIARSFTGLSLREFSLRLAESRHLQRFCRLDDLHEIHIPGKSACQRYEAMFTPEVIEHVIIQLNLAASNPRNPLELEAVARQDRPVSVQDIFIDSTCVDANIHFPVDWVLLRDVVRTLMKATLLIRNQGLKHRMESPKEFIRRMNQWCIKMTHTRRKKNAKRLRKWIFRQMKKLCRVISSHARRHMQLLENRWEETEYSHNEAWHIISRIERILERVPHAIFQAHERIIGERKVPNRDKMLSVYEDEIHVIVRGKASNETEFGNTLLLAEQADGIIVYWKFFKEKAPKDSQCLEACLNTFHSAYGCYPDSVTGDRGFHSQANSELMANRGIKNRICPTSVKALEEAQNDPEFSNHQRRRGQTEGRIGILQKVFLGNPLLSKGFESRHLHVAIAILTHNLWVIARLPKVQEKEKQIAA